VELISEFAPVIRLNDLGSKREPRESIINELNRCFLVFLFKDFQHSQPRTVVDGRILVKATSLPVDSTQEFDINLKTVTRFWLLIAFPSSRLALISLILRKTIELESLENPVNSRSADLDVMIPMKIHRDFFGAEMITLTKVEEFGQDFGFCGSGEVFGSTGSVF